MAKEILFGNEARLKIKAGIDKAASAVAPTLGAVGMSAVIEFPGLDPIDCDDGVTILKNLEFKDHYENIGLQKLRKAAVRTSTEGGDGTATTTVLTQALVAEAFKEISNDSSRIRDVRERLSKGLQETIAELTKIKRDITVDDIQHIAEISSLDPEVAKVITEIIKEVGVDGIITVDRGSQLGYSKEIVKGARFDKGYISQYFVNQEETESVVLENPYIVLVDRVISMNEQILPILNSIGVGSDILFIADDVNGLALASLVQNARAKTANIACVKNPYTGSKAREFLLDMAALTGATVISEERGMKLTEAKKELCGRAEKVIVTKVNTTIINGGGKAEDLDKRIVSIKGEIENTVSEYVKGMAEERLAMLTGGIGVIRVGTYTDTEFHAKKYKFDNAVNATQAALQEGILTGGGSSLLTVSMKVEEPMFKNALVAPFAQMVTNAAFNETYEFEEGMGIDFKTKQYVNMFDAGIIDPFKVVRLALESAVAITSSLVSTEVAIVLEVTNEQK